MSSCKNYRALHPVNYKWQSCKVRASRVRGLSTGISKPTCTWALPCRREASHAQLQRRTLPPAAALAAAGALGDEEPAFGEAIKRRLQQARRLWSSPYDKEIMAVALPALVGLAMEPVVNAFNAGLVGHLGTQQLSAVSLGTVALNSCTFLFSFLLFLTVPDVAAAVVKNDNDQVSRVAAQSLWVGLGCGTLTAAAVFCNADNIVAALKPPEAAVAALASDYIRIRSLAIPAVLLGYVATGVFRGFKDTRTPLLGTATSVAISFCMHLLLLNVLHLDVRGAALAAAMATWSSCVVMMGVLVRRGKVTQEHLARPPPPSVLVPLLQRGAVLGARNMVSFGMILFASTMCVRMGSAFQASFEVIRQLWLLSMPFFECLNVATQSLCASALGHEDRTTARSLLGRLLLLAVAIGALAGVAVWLLHQPLIAFFTSDPRVVENVLAVLPLICVFFPLDAAASILDGSLLAAKQSNYMSVVQVAGSFVQYLALFGIASSANVTALNIWVAIKIMSLTRILGGVVRNYASAKSAYAIPQTSSPSAYPVAVSRAPAAASSAAPSAATEHSGRVTTAAAHAVVGAMSDPTVKTVGTTDSIDGAATLAATVAASALDPESIAAAAVVSQRGRSALHGGLEPQRGSNKASPLSAVEDAGAGAA